MADMCTDNRFEVIEEYKQKLIECTNIEMAQDEMAVIDNILFRFWQMGWLPAAQPETQKYVDDDSAKMTGWICPVCGRGLSPFTRVCPCNDKWEITCKI